MKPDIDPPDPGTVEDPESERCYQLAAYHKKVADKLAKAGDMVRAECFGMVAALWTEEADLLYAEEQVAKAQPAKRKSA